MDRGPAACYRRCPGISWGIGVEFEIIPERLGDDATIARLNEDAFGPGRYVRAAYRLREGIVHEPDLSFVALKDGRMIGSVRLTRILIGTKPALLLGPLAVEPAQKGRGAGRMLVRAALDAARAAGHKIVMLVGDEPYYGPLGFRPLEPYQVVLPAPADPKRTLFAELKPGALDGLSGEARPLKLR